MPELKTYKDKLAYMDGLNNLENYMQAGVICKELKWMLVKVNVQENTMTYLDQNHYQTTIEISEGIQKLWGVIMKDSPYILS